jgi:hypothetical protein
LNYKVIINGDIAAIEVYNKTYKRFFYVLVDTEDIDLIEKVVKNISVNVRPHTNYCLIRDYQNKTRFLHRFLMNTPNDLEVDHINRNGLDNRKTNLKNCTHSENMRNRVFG